MVRHEPVERTVERLERRVVLAVEGQRKISRKVERLERKYKAKEISRDDYSFEKARDVDGRTLEEWGRYYDSYLKFCRREIRNWKKKILNRKFFVGVGVVALMCLIMLGAFLYTPTFVGFAVQDQELLEEGVAGNVTEVDIVEADFDVETVQYRAVVGRPVKWLKKISVSEKGSLLLELPEGASDISILTGEEIIEAERLVEEYDSLVGESDREDLVTGVLTGNVVADVDESLGFLTKVWRWLTGFGITGQVVLEEDIEEDIVDGDSLNLSRWSSSEDEVAVEYYTEAPGIVEEKIGSGKRIVVSADDEFGYENILAYVNLEVESENAKVFVYHVVDGNREAVDFVSFDLNEDGLIDYVEWNVEHLSEQVFEIVIVAAEHLNKKREFVEDVYDYVNETDSVVYVIPKNQFVRAYFESELTSENVIDIVVHNERAVAIEIYEEGGDEVIGKLDNVLEGAYYFELNHTGSQAVFDLRSVDGDVVYDYVHDGKPYPSLFTTGPTDDGPVSEGSLVTFTATATSAAYSHLFVVCDAAATSITCSKGTPPTAACSGGLEFCQSGLTVSGVETSCSHDTSGESGAVGYNAYTCNENGDSVTASGNPYSYTVLAANAPPVLAGLPDVSDNEDFGTNTSVMDLWDYASDVEDADSALTYGINSQSDVSAVDCSVAGGQFISCTSVANVSGFNDVNVSVADTGALEDSDVFRFTVDPVNDNPWNDGLSDPSDLVQDSGLNEDVFVRATLDVAFRDVEEDQVPTSYVIQGQTGSSIVDCVFDGSNNIDCTTQAGQSGSSVVTVRLSDSGGLYTDLTFTVSVLAGNVAPVVYVDSVVAQDPLEGGVRGVDFTFSVEDEDGALDVDPSSAEVLVWRSGEAVRVNSSCVNVSAVGNFMNFSCVVDMWYFDGSGEWGINVSVDDLAAEGGENTSTTFTYNQLTAMVMSPTALAWDTINVGATDLGSTNDPLVVNNTGNDQGLSIQVTAYDLQGESFLTDYIYAANFSVSGLSEGCAGDLMVNGSGVVVSGLSLDKGDNDLGAGQEEVYFCLKGVASDIRAQDYSSSGLGAWDIRIVLVVLTAGRRKKKNGKLKDDRLVKAMGLIADEVKEKYSMKGAEVVDVLVEELMNKFGVGAGEVRALREEKKLEIPLSVFDSELGALEAVVKYMKENLGMKYSEIGVAIGRDQRTIWTAYKKSVDKDVGVFECAEGEEMVPLSVFGVKGLTVLESVVFYLKRKGLKYSEIGEVLGRDQRNVWGVCKRAEGKVSGN